MSRSALRPVGGDHERRVLRMRSTSFVPSEARLQRPQLREDVVLRGELVDTLRESASVPIVLVTGPPGYGKTTLLAQWDDEDERPFTWLSLEPAANDPAVLVTYLTLALQRVGDVDAGVLTALADRTAVPTVLLPRLGRMLANRDRPFVLVLDDAEVLSSAAALSVLQVLVDHLAPGAQIAISGRTLPDLPWSRLRSQRRLLSIGPDQLRFRAGETRALLSAAGVCLPDADLEALLARTEGWPAGTYLAALSLRQAAERRDELTAFGGSGSALAEHLRRELLGRLPLAQRRFLVRTSILDRMCAPLCDAVLGGTGAGEMLIELAQSNLFLVPLERHEEASGQWYRYHHLFADLLRSELAREEPETVAALHARASRWLEEAGDGEAAVQHALSAGEGARAARLVWSHTGPLIASGRAATLCRWLDGFAPEARSAHAQLALAAAWCALDSGHRVEPWLGAAERGLYPAARPGAAAAVTADLALLHAKLARRGVRAMRADAELALRLQPAEDPWRALALYLQGVAVLLGGDPDAARSLLATAERFAAAQGLTAVQALCLAQLAVLAAETGTWEAARGLVDQGSALLVETGIGDSAAASPLQCVAALVRAKEGRPDEARQRAQHAIRLAALLSSSPPWLAIETRYLLGRTHLLLGDTAAARVLLSEAQSQLRDLPDAPWLSERLAEAWAHVEELPLAMGIGPSALTSAELRVLLLLPTHLSFEQISHRLSVSRNTVKTQAIAAYRKLGVSSRSEAVERARSLGMLGD